MSDSNVGRNAVYAGGDQRNVPQSEQHTEPKFHEGEQNSHDNDDPSMSTRRW
jgi:hypothetical protein